MDRVRASYTKYADGMHCQMERYFKYHHLGTGIQQPGTSIALSTGIAVHRGLEKLAKGSLVDEAVTKTLVEYRLDSVGLPPETVEEQARLIEGLIRVWEFLALPTIKHDWDIIGVEQFYDFQLGSLTVTSKPDLLLETKDPRNLEHLVVDFKTVNNPTTDWAIRTASSMQFMLMQHALQEQGIKVKFVLHGLVKGSYKGKWDPNTRTEHLPKWQQSPLCYAYKQEGNPPFGADVWEPEEWYQTRNGFMRKLDSSFERRPTSEYPGGVKAWVDKLAENGLLGKFLVVTEPFSFPEEQVKQALRSLEGHEMDWASRMERLNNNFSWEVLDRLVPRSYNCHNFDGTECQFKPICFRGEDGLWKEPLKKYIKRGRKESPAGTVNTP